MVEQTDEIQAIQTHESVNLVHMKSTSTQTQYTALHCVKKLMLRAEEMAQ